MEVVKTTKAGHARELASTVDINLCSDGRYHCLVHHLNDMFYTYLASNMHTFILHIYYYL